MSHKPFQRLVKSTFQRYLVSPRLARTYQLLFRISLCGMGLQNYENAFVSGEDHLIRHVLPALLNRPQPVLIDVGAHSGRFALALMNRFPAATIHAFEPHPGNLEQLRKLESRGLRVHASALGARSGRAVLYDRMDRPGSEHASLYQDVVTSLHGQATIPIDVVVTTLDQWAAEHVISKIDFMKLDVEGSELDVLEGAARLLERSAIDVIMFEFNEMNSVTRVFLRDFRTALAGFSFHRLLPRGLVPVPTSTYLQELFAYQNILAVRPRDGRAGSAVAARDGQTLPGKLL